MHIKNPSEVAAAARIADAARNAIADAMGQHSRDPWDPDVLAREIARLLGVLLRGDGATPDQLDDVVRFLREVYAGVYSGSAMTVQQAIAHYCRASAIDPGRSPLAEDAGDPPIH